MRHFRNIDRRQQDDAGKDILSTHTVQATPLKLLPPNRRFYATFMYP